MNELRQTTSSLRDGLGRLYSYVPNVVDQVLLKMALRLRDASPRRVTFEQLTNPQTTALAVGRSASMDYFLERLLGDAFNRESLGDHKRRAIQTRIDSSIHKADLVMIRGTRRWTDREFDDRYWRIPDAIGSRVDLVFDSPKLPWNNKSNQRNQRLIKKSELTWSVSHEESDFDYFYREMYTPFTRDRFGEQGISRSEHRARRHFRSGGLLWVFQGDRRLAATLFSIDGTTVYSRILAPDPQYDDAIDVGGLSGTYFFTMQWAMDNRYKAVDLGASRPSLTDGVLVHKKYWGSHVCELAGVHDELLIRWDHTTPAIARFLHKTPWVVRDGARLSGLTAMPTDEVADPKQTRFHLNKIAMPGLARLAVIADQPWRYEPAEIKGIPIHWLSPATPRADFMTSQASV